MSIAARLVAIGAFKTGTFRLASGRTSDFYVDVKETMADPALLETLAMHAAAYTPGHDAVAGTVLGGVPFATALALGSALPLLLVRPEAKTHGTTKQVEGRVATGARVLLVEDVATSGGSLQKAVHALRAAGAVVTHAVAVVDREEGARALLAADGVTLHALVTLTELQAATKVRA